jgi:outer membrane protein OmpA-like peptidoglycan-associated protein
MRIPEKNLAAMLGGIALFFAHAAVSAPLSVRSNSATVEDMVALPSNVAFAPDMPLPAPRRDGADDYGDSGLTSETVAELGRMNEELVRQLSTIKDQVDAMDGAGSRAEESAPEPGAKTVAAAGPNTAAETAEGAKSDPVAPLNGEEELASGNPVLLSVPGENSPSPELASVKKPAESSEIPAGDSPFGVSVTPIPHKRAQRSMPNRIEFGDSAEKRRDGMFAQAKPRVNPFVRTFSAIRPQKPAPAAATESKPEKKPAARRPRRMSSADLKRELRSAYISENRYLSAAEDGEEEEEWEDEEEEDEEEESDSGEEAPEPAPAESAPAAPPKPEPVKREQLASAAPLAGAIGAVENYDGRRKAGGAADLPPGPLKVGNREVLQMKLEFNPDDDAVSAESVNIIRSFAQIVTDSPTKTIEIGISERVAADERLKKLTARRVAIVSNILRHAGVSDRQIHPVLTSRDPDSFSFRAVDNDAFERIHVTKGEADAFGEGLSTTSYELMRW